MANTVLSQVEIFREPIFEDDGFQLGWTVEDAWYHRQGSAFTPEYDDWIYIDNNLFTSKSFGTGFYSDDYDKVAVRTVCDGSNKLDITVVYTVGTSKPFGTITTSGFFEGSLPPGKSVSSVQLRSDGGNPEIDYIIFYKGDKIVVQSENLSIDKEVNVIDRAIFDIILPRSETIAPGDAVKLYIQDKDSSDLKKVFSGKISMIKKEEQGQMSLFSCEALGYAKVAIDYTVSYSKESKAKSSHFFDLTQPLLDNNVMDRKSYMGSDSIRVDKASRREILSELISFADEYELNIYCPISGDVVYGFIDGTFGVIDTISTSDSVTTLQYVEDDRRIRNTVNIQGTGGIFPSGSIDYYTEDITNWDAFVNVGDVGGYYWYELTPEQYNQKTTGNYSVRAGTYTAAGKAIPDLWLICSLGTDLNLDNGGRLEFDYSHYEWNELALPFANYWKDLEVYLCENYDTIPPRSFAVYMNLGNFASNMLHDATIWSTIRINISGENKDKWTQTDTNNELNWNSIRFIGINLAYGGYYGLLTGGLTGASFAIDRLHVNLMPITSSYGDSVSVTKYDPRELVTEEKFNYITTQAELDTKAQSLIDPISSVEVSIRRLTFKRLMTETYPGRNIYVNILNYVGTYNVRAVNYNLDGFDLNVNLTLSKSLEHHPVLHREREYALLRKRVSDLEKRLGNVISGFPIEYTDRKKTSSVLTGIGTLDFDDIAFDWQSISSLSTEWNANFLDWFPNGFFPADSSGRGKFGDYFINADLLASLAVTEAKLADNAVSEAKILNEAVTTAKLGFGAIDLASPKISGLFYLSQFGLELNIPFDNECTDFSKRNRVVNFRGTGTVYAPTYTDGNFGRGWTSSGNNFRFEINDTPTIDFSDGVTAMGWFKVNSIVASSGMGKGYLYQNMQSGSTLWTFRIIQSGNYWEGGVCNTGGSVYELSATNTIELDTWEHICMTADDSSLALYVNGTLNTITAISGTLQDSSDYPIFIGKIGLGSSGYNGVLDEIKVYNRALSSLEVHSHYKFGPALMTSPANDARVAGLNYIASNEGLILNLPFDKIGANSICNDWSESNLNGTLNGTVTLVSGKFGNAYEFPNGGGTSLPTGNYVSFTDPDAILGSSTFTISFWIYDLEYGDQDSGFLGNYRAMSGNTMGWDIWIRNDQIVEFVVGRGADGRYTGSSSQTVPTFGWHHIVCALDYDNSEQHIYIDGSLNIIRSFSNTYAPNTTGTDFWIGRSHLSASYYRHCRLDDIRYYNRFLNYNEVQTLYRLGSAVQDYPIITTTWLAAEAVTADKIAANAVTAGKINIVSHIIDGLTWDNPTGSSVTWTQSTLTYSGTQYTIDPGTTTLKNIYWSFSESSFTTTDSKPVLDWVNGDILIAYNDSGSIYPTWNVTVIHGGAIITQSITADEIHTGAITADKLNVVSHYIDGLEWSSEYIIPFTWKKWSACTMTYSGSSYPISEGSHKQSYAWIIWNYGDSTFSVEATAENIDPINGDCLVAYYDTGETIPNVAWNATAVYGGLIMTDAITTRTIKANQVRIDELNIASHIIRNESFSNNSPSSGWISWNSHHLKHKATYVTISPGSTDNRYVWWDSPDGSYSVSNSFPSISGNDCLVAYNDDGEYFIAVQPTRIHGGYIKTFSIEADHIKAHQITADKLKIQSHYLYNATFSNNDPSAGYISWDKEDGGESIVLTYKALSYTISPSNTNNTFTWWNYGDSSFSTAESVNLGFHDVLIAYNDNGTVIPAFMASMLHGGAIVTDSITAIQIAAGVITADELAANAVTANKILANAITTSKLGLSTLSSDPAGNTGEMWYREDLKQLRFRRDASNIAYIPTLPSGWAIVQDAMWSWENFIKGLGNVSGYLLMPPQDNMLSNGMFELDSNGDGTPDDWIRVAEGSPVSTVQLSTDQKEGGYSVEFVADSNGDWEGIRQTVPVEGGKTYILKLWTKAESVENCLEIWHPIFDRDRVSINNIGKYERTASSTSWTEVISTITVDADYGGTAPAYMQIKIGYKGDSSGSPTTIRFDSIWLQKQIYDLGLIGDALFTGVTGLAKLGANLFDGVNGLAKFAAGLFTADSDGRGKFDNLFVNTALIDNLAVDTAQIANLAVEEAKINNLAVTEAKIDNLAVTTGKINNLAVTNIKIGSGVIELDRTVNDFSQLSYFRDNRFFLSGEALTGYDISTSGTGYTTTRKNYIKLGTGADSISTTRIQGYPIVRMSKNPHFKCRIRTDDNSNAVKIIGIGSAYQNSIRFWLKADGTIYARAYQNDANYTEVVLQAYSANTDYILEATYDYGTKIIYSVDNVPLATIGTNLPTDVLKEDVYAKNDNPISGSPGDKIFEIYYFTVTEDWL